MGLVSRAGLPCLCLTDYTHLQQRPPHPWGDQECMAAALSLPPPSLRSKVQTLLTASPGHRERAQRRGGNKKAHPPKGYWPTLCLPPVHPSWRPPCFPPLRSHAQGPVGVGATPTCGPSAAPAWAWQAEEDTRLDRGQPCACSICPSSQGHPTACLMPRHGHEQVTTTKVSWPALATSDEHELWPKMASLLSQTKKWIIVGFFFAWWLSNG